MNILSSNTLRLLALAAGVLLILPGMVHAAEEDRSFRLGKLLVVPRAGLEVLYTSNLFLKSDLGIDTPEENENPAADFSPSSDTVTTLDADLRKPRVHRIFDLAAGEGLSTFLSGLSKEPAVLKTNEENLSVLPAGSTPPNPSELLGSKRMKELMAFLKKEYDIVVFDSSPTLTVADSLILSKEADSTLLVVRAGKTTYDLLRRGLKSFADVDTEILGIVMNAVDEKKNGYYYYTKYDAYYSGDKARSS